jgi:hypothetical protein
VPSLTPARDDKRHSFEPTDPLALTARSSAKVVSINTPLEADSGTQPCHKPCRSHRRIAHRRLGLDSANSVRELQVGCSARPPARFLRVCLSIA